MDTSLIKQFSFLIDKNSGAKLEKIIEQVLESNLLNINDLYLKINIHAVIYTF